MTKPLLGGLIARNGVIAAQLAAIGMTSREALFDNPSGFCGTNIADGVYDLSDMANNLGRPFRIQYFKRVRQYPCCGTLHGVLDSILGLIRDEKFNYQDVESIEISQSYRSIVMRYDRPVNDHEARFSLRYAIAAALVNGKVGIDSFSAQTMNDPAIRETMDKVRINIQTIWEVGAGDRKTAVPVNIRLKDGRKLVRATDPDQVLGSYGNPLGIDFIVSKFRENASMALPTAKVEQAINVWSPVGHVENIVEAVNTLIADEQ